MNEDALVQALQDALTTNLDKRNGFMTSRELMKELHCTHKRLLDRLHLLDDEGRLEIEDVTIKNLAGRNQSVPAYRLMSKNGDSTVL